MRTLANSISQKLTAINLLVSGTAVLLACIALFAYDLNSLRASTLDELATQAQIIGENSASPLIFNDPQAAERTLAALDASPHIIFAGIYTPSGDFFAGYKRDLKSAQAPLRLPSSAGANHWLRDRKFQIFRPILLDGKPIGTVYLTSDINALLTRLYNYLIILGAIILISLGAALLVSYVARRAVAQPIMLLAETAQTVSLKKNYALRAAPSTAHDEIGVLIDSFNEMLAEIQKRDSDLKESEQQFRSLADSVPQLAWMAGPDGYITWYNRRWYQFTGTTPEQMQGWGWQSVHDPERLPEVLVKWRGSLEKGEPFEMVFPLRGRDNVYREFLTLALPVRDPNGKIVRWFGTNTDITEQRRSEEILRRTEKLAATGRLAASIAHEINNPLEAVTNLVYLARKQPSKADSYLNVAEQELERIAEITKHTLGFYRDTSAPVVVSLAEVLQGVLGLYNNKLTFKKIVVKQRYEENTEILGFPGELRQIFANLVVNAIEAMDYGGRLIIKASVGHDWSHRGQLGVRVSLMDNGAGMENDRVARIFDAFFTTKQDTGTGLGLWLIRNLVAKYGGSIRVRSRTDAPKNGTIFTIFFPNSRSGNENPFFGDNEVYGTTQ